MTTREQFTDEEWASVSGLSGAVIMAASLADGHMMPSVREIKAGADALTEGTARYPESTILHELLAAAPKSPSLDAGPDEQKPGNVEEVIGLMLVEIEQGVAAARANLATEEFAQLREILLAVAHAVVERLGDGFMGSGKDKVDTGEATFLERLTAILADA
jgi:hypothetical protein